MENYATDPILLNIPESFESPRLLIRAPRPGDGAAINGAVQESLEELRPWMPWAEKLPAPEESEAVARRGSLDYLARKDMMLLLFHKETGQLVGASGLHRMDWQVRRFEIGYWVRSSFANQGYITEAVHAIAEFAIRELSAARIEIRCDSRNDASRRVAERAGFTLEGTLRLNRRDSEGALGDTLIFSKVRGVEF